MRDSGKNQSSRFKHKVLFYGMVCALFSACTDGGGGSSSPGGSSLEQPEVTSFDPVSGDYGGGTLVTLSGSGFLVGVEAGTVVTFGPDQASEVVVVDDTTITCLSPGGTVGEQLVVAVINSRGSGAACCFEYVSTSTDGPQIEGVDPESGEPGGGTLVTITGSGFTEVEAGETSVLFGEISATEVVVVDDATINCLSPPGNGVVGVSVSNPRGVAELAESFTYVVVTSGTPADIDGDGLMDLVVGAPLDDAGGDDAGSVHAFLSSGSLSSHGDQSASEADLIITGAGIGDRFGSSVATGDLNEDGYQDLVVAATHASGGGAVYVFNGPLDAGALGTESADHVFSAEGTAAPGSKVEDRFGSSISLTDVDGDGVIDLVIGAPGADHAASGTSVFAAGLRSPMGLHLGPDGALWVAESGSGSADPADPVGTALDDAGVARIATAGVVEEVISGLPSITDEGFAGGTSDLIFDSDGSLVLAQQNGESTLSNSVLEFDVSAWTPGSQAQGPGDVVSQWDIGSFGESLGYGHNNAYGVAEGSDGHLYVVNAGSNSIFKVERPSGVMSEFATFPQVPQPSPFGPPFTDSVPTRILAHADGFYVVNLTGFPFNDGAASIFDVDYAGNVTELVTGLSRATDVAINPSDGLLYVAQFDGFDLTVNPPWLFGTGSVVRVTGSGLETVAEVITPTGIAFDVDGTMYVSSLITGLIYSFAGTPPAEVADVGVVYVFRGGSGQSAHVHASGADVFLAGENMGDEFGCSSSHGDFNGDGQDDLFVGARGAGTSPPDQPTNGGAVFLWLGPANSSGSSLDADASYYMLEEDGAMGSTLAVGDVNGDGLDDLIAGAPYADSDVSLRAGLVVVFHGDPVVYSADVSSADTVLHGMSANGGFGTCVITADFNGDGTDDILTAAPSDSYGAVRNGRAFVFDGGVGLQDTWAIAAEVIIAGRFRDFEHFGSSVGSVDLNLDGESDLCVGALGGDISIPGAGSVHTFLGGEGLVDTDASMDELTLEGEDGLDRFGAALSKGE